MRMATRRILAIVALTALATALACGLYFGLALTTPAFFPNSWISWIVILYPCVLYLFAIVWVVLRWKIREAYEREAIFTIINIVGVTLIGEGISLAILGTRWIFFTALVGGAIVLISLHLYRKDLQKKKRVLIKGEG